MPPARLRLILHGAIVLLVGLLAGLPTTTETIDGAARHWHTTHEALIMMGVWMLAASSVVPQLVLETTELTALVWAHLLMGYGFMVALTIGGIAGVEVFSPGATPASLAAFVAAVLGILGAIAAAALTIKGAAAALRAERRP